jgi:hypothetical protein
MRVGVVFVLLGTACGSPAPATRTEVIAAAPEPTSSAPPVASSTPAQAPVVAPLGKGTPYPPPALNLERPTNVPTNKSMAALVTELGVLEKSFAKTAVTDPDHFPRGMQLAEHHCALEVAAKSKPDLSTKAHARAVEVLRLVIDNHDSEPKLDEAMFLLATEYEHERREMALATYLMLVKKRPMSRLVRWAYKAYGDLYFDDALQGKIDWTIPREAYARAIQASSQQDAVTAYCTLRVGFVHWYQKDPKGARNAFDGAIKIAQQAGATEIETEAVRARDSL